MKIAVWHNLPSGGGKRALYYHVRGLVERGHTIESWCPPTADQTYLPLGELIAEHVLPIDWQPRAKKSVAARLTTLRLDPHTRIEALDQHCRRCAGEINSGGFDLLFANSSFYQAVSSIGRYVRLPKVIYLQEPTREYFEAMPEPLWNALPPPAQSYLSPSYLRDYLKDLIKTQTWRAMLREETRNARAFDTMLVNSFYSRESILRAYGVEAKVCYLGIDTDQFTDLQLPREDYVVGLGAFVKLKNIEFVLHSLAEMPKPRPRLVWIGNSADTLYLEAMKRLAATLDVDFEPLLKIPDEQLVDVLNRAMLMVYSSRLEPFGFAPLEANACGVPVLAVAEGGVRETIVHGVNGLLIDSDPREMAAAITRLMNDRAYARRLGQTARQQVVEKWSVAASVDRLEQKLFEAIGRREEDPAKARAKPD
ncbi:MAG: glycosyltransferase family 4 protein [Pyrinomonadaceae bacterium]|nr:glycosyltransferase family 4 protein [Pyrinomonadaceae bacterium]